MEKGWKNRAVGSTMMNAESSRSHSIFTIHLERCDEDDTGEEHIRVAKLNLVDLAGSERQAKTGRAKAKLVIFILAMCASIYSTTRSVCSVSIVLKKAFSVW